MQTRSSRNTDNQAVEAIDRENQRKKELDKKFTERKNKTQTKSKSTGKINLDSNFMEQDENQNDELIYNATGKNIDAFKDIYSYYFQRQEPIKDDNFNEVLKLI